MALTSHPARTTSDPGVCHGQPVVRGLRCPVQALVEMLGAWMSVEEVLEDYGDLERGDVLAALGFAALAVGDQRVVPLGVA